MRRVYVGIDIGSKSCAAAVRNSRGKVIEKCEFPTSEKGLIELVSEQNAEVHVMFEESELAGWAYRTLLPHAERVMACDPVTNAWIAKGKKKSDPIDAAKLSELLRLGSFNAVYHPPGSLMTDFKVIVQSYERASKRLARAKVQIKAAFRRQGVIISGTRVYGAKGREEALALVKSEPIRQMLLSEYEGMDFLAEQKAKALRLVKASAGQIPEIERITTVPGVGVILASKFVAYVADPNRFNRKGLIAYSRLGIVKRESSGSVLCREHLDNAGNGVLKDVSRKAFDAANRMRDNGVKRSYESSLKRTGNHTHARLNTQRKILWIMNVVWRDGTEYRDELVGKGA